MARKVMLVDDLDGSPADETVTISYKGAEYTLDLSSANAETLDNALRPFLSKATRNSKKRPRSTAADKAKNDSIRDWARSTGQEIPMRGRIPESIRQAYEARNESATSSNQGNEPGGYQH